MQAYFFLILYVALVFQDFKFAELTYHFCFETAFKRYEENIVSARKYLVQIWRDNCAKWWGYLKKNIVAFVHLLSRFLPTQVQTFTEPFFTNLLASYEKAYLQSQALESTTELSDS